MKTTIKKLIESTNIPAPLVKAVIKQIGGWDSFKESAPDITAHGIDGGFHGFIYYSDTEPFARKNRTDILVLAKDQVSDLGVGFFEMFAGFRCMQGLTESQIAEAIYSETEDTTTVLNCLAWYAAEEVARAYCDMLEQD